MKRSISAISIPGDLVKIVVATRSGMVLVYVRDAYSPTVARTNRIAWDLCLSAAFRLSPLTAAGVGWHLDERTADH